MVDVLVHDLSGTGGRASNVARHHTRIEGSALGESGTANPYRLSIFAEQYSPPIAAHEGPDRKLRVPSFFHTSVPARESPDVPVQGKSLSPLAHIRTFLSPAARARVSLFLARGNVSKEVIWGVSSWPGFAPVAKAWDGGGNRAGANSSAHTMIVLGVGGGDASVQEWDQHWVRVEDGVEDVDDPYADQSASVGVKSKLRLYTPSFINFFGKTLDYPATSLDVDALGRFWTAGSGDTAAVDAWVAYLREAGGQSRSGSDAIRPGSRVEQTTFVHRAGPSVAHPWELERLARVRARGMFLPKEHLGLPIFSAPSTRGSEPFKPLSNNAKGEEMGFLPTAPTGIAVDHARGIVLVVGAYEERGVAMCAMPEGWAEM